MKLVVQIPALNEERTIAQVIQAIPARIEGVDEIRVLVVDDGSTDRTGELARGVGAVVVRHAEPRGVGVAFQTGIRRAEEMGADIVVTIDADGQFNPADIPALVQPILQDKADFVTASRFADAARAPVMPKAKRWGNDVIAGWLSSLIGQRFHDVSCGFRAYSSEAYFRLVLLGEFTYTHETFLNLAFSGMRIKEVPLTVRGQREFGKSRVASNLFTYGWRAASIILKTYRDYRPMRFFGFAATSILLVAACFFAFLLAHYVHHGVLTPFKWTGLTGLVLSGIAMAVFTMGVVADMLDRVRASQGELLFRLRRLERLLVKQGAPSR
jgi:glycosyltransferase involved in cell wall biosynthesis